MKINGYEIKPGVYLGGANLVNADLVNANLRGAILVNANLVSADLRGADLRGADLRGAKLVTADITGANLVNAKLVGADLGYANLVGTNLVNANLWDANLVNADLRGADLEGADLEGANITGTILEKKEDDKDLDEHKLLKECRQTGRTNATTEKVLKTVFLQMKETDTSKVLIEGDTATINGIKYKRVEEPKPKKLFDVIRNLGYSVDMCYEIVDAVKECLPDEHYSDGEDYDKGWNDVLRKIKDGLG